MSELRWTSSACEGRRGHGTHQLSDLDRAFVAIAAAVPDHMDFAGGRSELEHPDAPSQVRRWIGSPPQWLCERPGEPVWEIGLEKLGGGERGTIGIAQALGADLVVMDDRLGISSAQSRGLTTTGTLGVLERGADRGWIDLVDAFDRLRQTSFHVRVELLEAILARRSSSNSK